MEIKGKKEWGKYIRGRKYDSGKRGKKEGQGMKNREKQTGGDRQ